MSDEIKALEDRVDELEGEIQKLRSEASGHGSSKVRIRLIAEALGALMADSALHPGTKSKIGDCLDQFQQSVGLKFSFM